MIDKKLESPHMRHNLVVALERLANKERQWREWPDSNYQHAFWDSMLMAIDVFDEVGMEDNPPKDCINYTLYDNNEAEAIEPVIAAANHVCNEIGREKPDSAYMNSPLWEEVIRAAKHAYEVMIRNEPPNSYILECHKHNWDSTNWDFESRQEAYYRAYPEEKEREEREAREEREKQ